MAETEQLSIATTEKRVVLQYTSGPLKDIFRIVGRTTEVLPFLSHLNDRIDIEFASLIKVCPRWILYREPLNNSVLTGHFNEPLKGFDPAQV